MPQPFQPSIPIVIVGYDVPEEGSQSTPAG